MSYASTVLGFTPGGYWRLGEASGTLADSSGNSNTGTASGSPTYAQTGLLTNDAGTCLSFVRASSQRIDCGTASTVDPGDTFTVMAWIKRPSNNGVQNTIVSKGLNSLAFYIDASTNKLGLAKSNVSVIALSTGTVADTSRHFVVCTKSGSTVHFYIDGTEGTGTVTNATMSTANGLQFTIAADLSTGPTYSSYADLSIQEVAVFPTALSAANITTIYNAGAIPPAAAAKPSANLAVNVLLPNNF